MKPYYTIKITHATTGGEFAKEDLAFVFRTLDRATWEMNRVQLMLVLGELVKDADVDFMLSHLSETPYLFELCFRLNISIELMPAKHLPDDPDLVASYTQNTLTIKDLGVSKTMTPDQFSSMIAERYGTTP